MKNANPYLFEVEAVLGRVLALFDTDPLSPTYGLGDRFRWGWKLIDFANGYFQGAANGLAQLLSSGLLPAGINPDAVLRRIDAMFSATEAILRPNGSLEEAFPAESSFCVTAQVAFDLLSALESLGERISPSQREKWLDTVRLMIRFLHREDETHAFITNHLSAAAAALHLWERLTGEPGAARGEVFLRRVLAAQSQEGWFTEYQGADPGYQTLAMEYLTALHQWRPELGLAAPLARAAGFLEFAAHPDGSFGGLYGSRNTRFYYPGGIEQLAATDGAHAGCAAAIRLADGMAASIAKQTTITLRVMDEPNLIPMFNSYCRAATLWEARKGAGGGEPLPAYSGETWRKTFPGAGLLFDNGVGHYTIVSLHKGGVCYHFDKKGQPPMVDAGAAATDRSGRVFTTQPQKANDDWRLEGDRLTVTAEFSAVRRELPSPFQFLVLRLFSLSVFKVRLLRHWIKKALVRRLITGWKGSGVRNRREIQLGPNLTIRDHWQGPAKALQRLEPASPFSAIHMASQGYWQKGDDLE